MAKKRYVIPIAARVKGTVQKSWSRTGLAESLKRGLISSYAARRGLRKTSLASREERPYRLVRTRIVLVEDPLLPGLVRGFIPERQPL